MVYFSVADIGYIMGWKYPKALKFAREHGEQVGTGWIIPVEVTYTELQDQRAIVQGKEARLLYAIEHPQKKQRPINFDLSGRTQEMVDLREAGKTLQEIADRYNLSRERVRQLIGNTGHLASKIKQENIRNEPADITNQEIASKYNLGLPQASKYRKDHWHAIGGDSGAAAGNGWERWAADELIKHGHSIELQPLGKHFDILVDGRLKIDVKSATGSIPPSLKNKAKNPRYHFGIRKNSHREPIDFYYLIIADTKDIFVVPYDILPMPKEDLTMSWPTARPTLGKYQKYHNRYDLLNQ